MKRLFLFLWNHKLITLAVLINLCFFISAFYTKWFDYFFTGSSVHYCCQGLDFYQIPNGFFAYINGGDLAGNLTGGIMPYAIGFPSNFNVYHPFFTVILGAFLILFDPSKSFYIWMGIKLIITLIVTMYLYKSFKGYKYIDFGILVFLANFSQYNEIRLSQYQFVFNIALLLLLVGLNKDKDFTRNAFFYFVTLIAKPISLLWAPILLLKRKYETLFFGLLGFGIMTLVFYIRGDANYYIDNIISHFLNPIRTNTIDIITLDQWIRYEIPFLTSFIFIIKALFLAFILVYSSLKRVSINKAIFLMIIFFLFFYDLVYQYHYSILGPILAICVILNKEFQTRSARILILIIAMPHLFFLLRIFNIGFIMDPVLGPDPTWFGWAILVAGQLLPIILLTIIVIKSDIKDCIKDLIKFIKDFSHWNKEEKVFG